MAQGQFTSADLDAPKQQGQFTASDVDKPADTYQGGFLHHFGSSLWNAGVGLVNAVTNPAGGLAGTLVQNIAQQTGGWGRPSQAAQEFQQRTAEGRSLPYKVMAPVAETVAGLNVRAQEEAANRGDVGGVLGEAAGPTALAVAPLATEGALRGANKAIPSTTRAAGNLAALEAQHGNAPVPVQAAHAAATDIVNRMAVTGENAHPLVHAYLDRAAATDLANTHPEIAGELAQRGIPTQNPLTFAEGRTFLKRVNAVIKGMAKDNPDRGQLQQFATALDQDVSVAAQQGGFLDDYTKARAEYRRGSQIIRAGEAAGPLVGGAIGATLGRGAGGLATAEAAGAGAIAGRYLGKPIIGSMVRSVIERGTGSPTITAPPEAPGVVAPPAPPAEAPSFTGPERRTDAAARAKFAAMTPEQQYQTAFTNHVTGMPNARAMEAAGPAPAHGFSDVAGLKWLNDTYGQEAGNALLQAKARALQDAGIQSYHTGGDEFSHLAQSPVDLNNRLAAANQNLRQAVIEVTDPTTGKKQYYNGAEFRYGVGPDAKTAETNMLTRKAAQKSTRGTQGTLRQVPGPPAEVTQ